MRRKAKRLARRHAANLYMNLIRPRMPTTGVARYAGLPVGIDRKLGDEWLPPSIRPRHERPRYEDTSVRALRDNVVEGDKVVVVGGGAGVTAVVAAKIANRVDCFEASASGVDICKRTAELNAVADRIF